MQIDSGVIGAAGGFFSSLFLCGVVYGILREKVLRLEQDIASLDSSVTEHYVKLDLFHATIEPLREQLTGIKADIRRILELLTK